MAKSRVYEDILLHVGDVRFKKWTGSLVLFKDRICWVRFDRGWRQFRGGFWNYKDIRTTRISPEDETNKIQLNVVRYNDPIETFQFENRSGLEAQTRDRDQIKEHLEKLLPKFKDLKKEQEEKTRIFYEYPVLWKLYKRLVVIQGISDEEFWIQHPLVDLIALDDQFRDWSIEKRRQAQTEGFQVFDDEDELRIDKDFFRTTCKVECKRIIHPWKKSKSKINLKRKYAEATTSTNTSVNQSITNDKETSGLPTKPPADILEKINSEQESNKPKRSCSRLEPSLCGLPTDHVLIPCIFIHLDVHDLLNLSQKNRHMENAVKQYLPKIETLDFSKRWEEPISDLQFKILHEHCRSIRELNFNKCYWLADYQLHPLLLNNTSHLEKLVLKHTELETVKLLRACRNLKSVKILSLGYFNSALALSDILDTLCENNLNLDDILHTHGNCRVTKIISKICKA